PGTSPTAAPGPEGRCVVGPTRRESVGRVVVGVQGNADLVQVVLAGRTCGGLADLLDSGHQQANQDGDDGDDDQQLDQRECCSASVRVRHGASSSEKRRTITDSYDHQSSTGVWPDLTPRWSPHA